MSRKSKKQDPSVIIAVANTEEEKEKSKAQIILNPAIQSAVTVYRYNKGDYEVNINSLIEELSTQNDQVHNGSSKRTEALLLSQAHTLDALFGHYVGKAKECQYLEHLKTYMNIGLRAQSQCRATLEALAEVKNPRPYIQNNRAEYQQVNNGGQPQANSLAQAEEKLKSTNGLLTEGSKNYETVDFGRTETAGRNDQTMEAVGVQYGTDKP